MQESETVYPNDTTQAIRRMIAHLGEWRTDNQSCDQRHTAMVLSKLEEAELLSLRMVQQVPNDEDWLDVQQQHIDNYDR